MCKNFERLLGLPERSFFLFGPRGTGKSWYLRNRLPEATTFDLLDEARYQRYLADPAAFGDELRALKPGSTIVIDEIQRLPDLLNTVHRAIELQGLRFALCGSSARKLRRAGTNLLAGRATWRRMHPFVPEEVGADFILNDALRWGTLPVVFASNDRSDVLESYVRLYLKEEIQAEALVRNLPGFARFLPVAAVFHGQVLNVSSVARDAGAARTTVNAYLEILEDTLVAFRVPAYEARLRVRERRHPKLYWVDPGLPRALKGQLGPPTLEERGALFEGWVAGILAAYRDYRGLFDQWWYWASGSPTPLEVDFLLRRGDELAAIEVKASDRLEIRDFRGLRSVADLPGMRRKALVFQGPSPRRTQDGIDVLPVAEFLREVENGALFGA